MATKIRLKRIGRRNRPFYRIVLIDSRKKRDGAAIEQLGWYNPISDEKDCELNSERIIHWLKKGAQPSKAAKKLIKNKGISFEVHLMKSGADEKEIQKQLKKRDLDIAAAKREKKENTDDGKQRQDKKESILASKGENKLSTNAEVNEESSSTREVNDTSKTDASTGLKEEE